MGICDSIRTGYELQRFFSKALAIPVIGLVATVPKAAFSIAQLIVGFVGAIFMTLLGLAFCCQFEPPFTVATTCAGHAAVGMLGLGYCTVNVLSLGIFGCWFEYTVNKSP